MSQRKQQYRTLLVIGAIVLVALLLWSARQALFPFILGLIIAYLLIPIVNRLQRLFPERGFVGRARRVFAILIVYLVFFGAIAAAIMTIVPRTVNETADIIDSLPDYWREISDENGYWRRKYEDTFPPDVRERIESNLDEIQSTLASALRTALLATFGTVRSVFGFVAGLALLPLWLFYVLKDERRGMAFFYNLWPMNLQTDVRNIVGIIDRVLSAYIRGQVFLGFVVGIVTYIGLRIIGVSQAGGLAVLAGIFELIPILGPWLSFIVAAIVVLATDPGQIWLVALLFLMVQQLENTFLVPKIQGSAVNMNPAMIMVLIVVGGAVFGILGTIAIVPLAAIARDVFVYIYKRLSDEPPTEARVEAEAA